MNAGQLHLRIAIDEPVATQNETGEEIVDFVSRGKVWGAIEPLNGHEQIQANQAISSLETRIRIRWSPRVNAINAKWRLRHKGTIYNIAAPPAHILLRRREIHLMCTSGLNLG